MKFQYAPNNFKIDNYIPKKSNIIQQIKSEYDREKISICLKFLKNDIYTLIILFTIQFDKGVIINIKPI